MTFGKSFDLHLRLSWFPSAGGMRKLDQMILTYGKKRKKAVPLFFGIQTVLLGQCRVLKTEGEEAELNPRRDIKTAFTSRL